MTVTVRVVPAFGWPRYDASVSGPSGTTTVVAISVVGS